MLHITNETTDNLTDRLKVLNDTIRFGGVGCAYRDNRCIEALSGEQHAVVAELERRGVPDALGD